MKYFRQMLESLKAKPVIFAGDMSKPGSSRGVYPGEMVFHFAEKSHPFVFVSTKDDPTELVENEKEVIDAPFQIFSIEMLGDRYLTVGREDAEIPVKVRCVLVVEQKPRQYMTIGFVESASGKTICVMSDSFISIVNAFLKRIRKEAVGMEHVRERIKVGTGKEKRTITIREVIHVSPKKLMQFGPLPTGRIIDWSHRFEVRSHWRQMTGKIGRDREGNPIPDWTWVKDYVKGPEDAPLIKKTRVVVEGK